CRMASLSLSGCLMPEFSGPLSTSAAAVFVHRSSSAARSDTVFRLCLLEVRLHNAIGYVAPAANRAGREPVIAAERDLRLAAARQGGRTGRRTARSVI